ncbi:hypothetical protein GE09DRAFT_1228228 [Coniochaeta sp. 2T2.1]|nr:hypothetical protein GE09DRAFT_1228228 [Coniochaeta sp. 2T2.1]
MASQATSSEQPAVNDIDPNGDVVMVVGPDKHEMRVSSNSLQLASKVFRAMLGPNWSEGQGLSKESPPKVTLEEDDAETMRTIFCILHFRNDMVPNELAPEKVLDIAIECDKYDMTSALRYTSAMWLQCSPYLTFSEAGFILTASFLFDNDERFKICSRRLVLYYQQSYLDLLRHDKIGHFLPFKAIYLLEQQRNHPRIALHNIINAAIKECCTIVASGKSCDWGKQRKDGYINFLSWYTAFKIHNMTVRQFMDKLRHVADDRDLVKMTVCLTSNSYHQLSGDQTYDKKADAIVKAAGLCLSCMQQDGSCSSHMSVMKYGGLEK